MSRPQVEVLEEKVLNKEKLMADGIAKKRSDTAKGKQYSKQPD